MSERRGTPDGLANVDESFAVQTYKGDVADPRRRYLEVPRGRRDARRRRSAGFSRKREHLALRVDLLEVRRSSIIVTGTMVSGPGDTVLRRGRWLAVTGPPPPPATFIMQASDSLTGVTIRYLTFDGNRYGAFLNCLDGNAPYYDLQAVGGVTVQWVDFINAPGTALALGGSATVTVSNFGQGAFGVQTPEQTATRSTAIWIDGAGNGAFYNAIANAGTAAITLNGVDQYAWGNLLSQNRYELSDVQTDPSKCVGVPAPCLQQGGQLFISADARNAWVGGNVIDGNTWPYGPGGPGTSGPPYKPLATGCTLGNGSAFNAGVEAYGLGHGFYNNEIANNLGSAMQFAGSEATGQITISSANPWDASDTPRFIERNGAGGITFLGTDWCRRNNYSPCQPASGVTLDDVIVRDNGGPSVFLDGVSNNGSYTGFINGSCISGNYLDRQPADIPTGQNILTFGVPGNYPDGYASYRGGACPNSQWPRLPAPASSHIPGWPW